MKLYEQWTNFVVDFIKNNGEEAFWKEYGTIEKDIYIKVLSSHGKILKGTLKFLADDFGVSIIYFMGFLDGINDSLNAKYDLENMNENSIIELDINYEKLYFNMLDSKADYLFNLIEWNSILTAEKKKEILLDWRKSKVVVNENKVGRNELCPCGSGKKYKKCCGKNE
jgi:preprotein translocase subunit SecA